MPTILPERSTRPPDSRRLELPDETCLENRSPDWLAAPRVLAGFTVFVGLIFLFFNYRPLWHTDLWGHLSYGRLLWETGGFPATEPLMPLATGVPFVDTAWLSQLVGFAAFSRMIRPWRP